jgi:hypothetical protein
MSIIPFPRTRRELAHRLSGGLEIALYWSEIDDSTSIEVTQRSTGERLTFGVPREDALAAFHHPFAHMALAASRGLGEVA